MTTKNRNSEVEGARIRNKQDAGRRAEIWNTEANSRLNELSKLFMTMSILVLTLTIPMVLDLLGTNLTNRFLLLWCWLFGFLSIIAGGISIVCDALYFRGLAVTNNNSELVWSRLGDTIENMAKLDEENRKNYKASSTFVPLIIQATFAFISLTLMIVVGGGILLGQKNTAQNSSTHQPREIKQCHKILRRDCRTLPGYYKNNVNW